MLSVSVAYLGSNGDDPLRNSVLYGRAQPSRQFEIVSIGGGGYALTNNLANCYTPLSGMI